MQAMRSTLNPEPQSLAIPVLVALLLHVSVVSLIACVGMLPSRRQPILDDEAMQVSMMILPKAERAMPDKASRAPRPTGEPQPQETKAEPAPIRESDLKVHQPEAKVTEGASRDRSTDREAAMRELLMDDALADLDEGPTDREQTDPNSDSTEKIDLGGVGPTNDPELVRWQDKVTKLFITQFNPLPAVVAANPGLVTFVRVQVDPETGRVLGYEIVDSSDNESYDRAAETAVQAVSEVPLPPENHRSDTLVLVVRFDPK